MRAGLALTLAIGACASHPASLSSTASSIGTSGAGTSGGTTTGGSISTGTGTSGSSSTTGGSATTTGALSGTSGTSGTGTSGGTPDAGPLTVTIQFDGNVGPGMAGCPGSPPKCRQIPELNVAANGTQVAQVTWTDLNVYDYSGTLLSTTPLSTFITNAGLSPGFPFEPHILYDEFIGRWLITTTCLYDCFLVSSSSDATGNWQGIYLANNGNDPGMHLGYDINGAYLAEFGQGDSDGNTASYSYDFFAIPSAELQWTTTFAPTHLNRAHNTPLDGVPIVDHNANKQPTDPAFFMAKTCPSGSCQNATNFSFKWLMTEVTWSGTTATYGSDQLIQTNVGSTQNQWLFNTPLNAPQLGSTIPIRTAETHRVMNAVQDGNHVHGVLCSGPCASGCGGQGVDANNLLFWVDLDCSTPSMCTVNQTAKIASSTEHYVFASVGLDSNGNVGIAAAAMSATIDPSIRLWGHRASDPANAIVGPITVIDGTQPYTCINNPVGFATAVGLTTVRDPLDGTKLWTTQQYGESGTACVWNTRIFQYQVR
jgi:hypothetical protein